MLKNPFTQTERRAVFSLSLIMGLRMIGLFMVLPIFALYAKHLPHATPLLIGLALGVYGLTQAIFQIPFGALSDKLGRKPIICAGLIIFGIGSMIAAFSDNIYLLILGRAIQGAGAVGSTILAMIADLTREEQRTKSMALTGMTIGLSFSLAMFIGPFLSRWFDIHDLFFLASVFGVVGVYILLLLTPTPVQSRWHRDTEPELSAFKGLLLNNDLQKLYGGIFFLHAIFTASFIAIPITLQQTVGLASNQQWHYFLPALLFAFVVSLSAIGFAESKQKAKPFFLGGISTIAVAELCLWATPLNHTLALIGLCLFFAGFTLLEAFLPSLVSRTAPATRKGSAMGIYSCAQFSGIFTGGLLGGWLFGHFHFTGVFLLCLALCLTWLGFAIKMRAPRFLSTKMWRINAATDWQTIAGKLQRLPGMVEVTYIAEESVAYLKMERNTAKLPEFIRLEEELQGV